MQLVLSKLFQVKYEDRQKLVLLSTVFFLAGIAEMVSYTSFMAIFTSRVGTNYLPQMYIAEAFLMPLEGWLLSVVVQKVDKERFMRTMYLFFVAIGLLHSMLLFTLQAASMLSITYYIVLFLSSNFVIRQQTLLMWNIAFDLCTTQQAKRLMPLFVLAAIAGGIVAGVMTSTLANLIGPEFLYAIAVLLLLAGYPFFHRALRRYLRTALMSQQEAGEGEAKTAGYYLKGMVRSRYLLIVVGIMTLLPAIYFVMEYQYFTVAQASFIEEKQLTSFYGLMVIILFSAAFLLQLFTSKLMELLGATNTILAITIIFLLSSTVVMMMIDASNALFAVAAGYSMLYLLLYYFAEPGYQFFFKVLAEDERDGYRYITQSIAASLGILVGSILSMLHSLKLLSATWQMAVSVGAALLLVIIAWYARKLYIERLVVRMRKSSELVTDLVATIAASIDQGAIKETIQRLLDHTDVVLRNFALDVLIRSKSNAWSAMLWQYAQRYEGIEKRKALEGIESSYWQNTPLEELEQWLDDSDSQVRLVIYRQLLARTQMNTRLSQNLERALQDDDVFVRAEALLYLDDAESLHTQLLAMLRSNKTAVVVLACQLVAKRQASRLEEQILYCTLSSKPVIKYEAIRTLGCISDASIVSSLLEMVLDGDKEQVAAVIAALVALGERIPILGQLVPLVTIQQLQQWQVVMIAMTELDEERVYKEQIVAASLYQFQQLSIYVQLIDQLLLQANATKRVWLELANIRVGEISEIVEDVIWKVYGYLQNTETSEQLRAALLSDQEERVDDGLEILSEGFAHPKLSQAMFQYYKSNRIISQQRNRQQYLASKQTGVVGSLELATIVSQFSDGWLQAIIWKGSGLEGGDQVTEHWEYWNKLEQIALLKQVELFAHLAIEELSLLATTVRELEVDEGTCLLQMNATSQPLTIVVEGYVELTSISPEGVTGTLGIVGAMQTVGEAMLFTGEPSTMTAEVILGTAKVLQIDNEAFIRLVRLYPDIAVGLLHALSKRMRTLEKMVVSMG